MNVRVHKNWRIIAQIILLLVIALVIPVAAIPVVDFSGTPTSGPKPLNVQFTDASTGNGSLIYAWDFGDGGTSTTNNPLHQYTNAGTYSVTLTVNDNDGPNTKTETNYITVNEAPPIAAFSGTPTSGPKPLNVQFTDASTGVITSYSWDFGDGNISASQNPSNQYTAVGSYTVTLIVTGPGGSDTETKTNYITVGEAPPVAGFSAIPTSGPKPLNVQFTDASTGVITSYSWDFGDGNLSIAQNPSNQYTAVGSYTVTLIVTGPGGSDTETKTNYITVGEAPPVAGFSAIPTSGPIPLNVQFIDASTGVITSYSWDFGDGNISASQNPSHTYSAVGSYTVILTVTGPGGSDFETKTDYITVSEAPPVAGFSATPQSGERPLNVQFTDASTGIISTYSWNFGDGNTSTLTNPSYQYTAAGSFTITLTVTGPGGSDSEIKNNYITVTNATTKIGVYKDGVWNLQKTGIIADLFFSYGGAGDTQLVGDWNGDGKPEAGIYNNGIWYLDYNGNGVYDGPVMDRAAGFGSAGYKPVVGDWDGTGKTKIGVELDGIWAIDYNGNYIWDGAVTDRFAGFGQTGDNPVIGDWDGTGIDKIGSEKDGFWAIDYNGNYVWDGEVTDRFAGFGQTGDNPVIGDWNGDGKDKIGMEINGFWATDYNGNYLWEGIVIDRFAGFGQTGDIPCVGDWDGNGRTEIGSHWDGFWAIDYNGNYVWDGAVTDRFAGFGQPGDKPVVGDWDSNSRTEIGSYKDGFWTIDFNGNYVWDGSNSSGASTEYIFRGEAGWTPVVGDWNGDGMTNIGIYKDGVWYLDYNENKIWDTGDIEYHFTSISYTIPVVGDWNGDGKTTEGYYKHGFWSLDYNGEGTYSKFYTFIGELEFLSVVGDWNGDGKTEVGVYKITNGDWYLDYDGNGEWSSSSDRFHNLGATGTPVIGDWNGDGKSKIGAYNDGTWRLDYIGNGSVVQVYYFGTTGSSPVVGDWNGDGKSKIGVYKDGAWQLDFDGNGVWNDTVDKGYNLGAVPWQPVVGKWS